MSGRRDEGNEGEVRERGPPSLEVSPGDREGGLQGRDGAEWGGMGRIGEIWDGVIITFSLTHSRAVRTAHEGFRILRK